MRKVNSISTSSDFTESTSGLKIRQRAILIESVLTLVTEKELTTLGFSGVESTDDGVTGDWITINFVK